MCSTCAARNLLLCGYCVAKLCHCLRFQSFLKRRVSSNLLNHQDYEGVPGLLLSRRVSSYLHPELHLSAILENTTLRLDCVLSGQVSPFLTDLFDKVFWVSQGFSTQSDSAQSKNLSRHVGPSPLSALTLSRSCSLLPVLASFSPSFWCSWSSWILGAAE